MIAKLVEKTLSKIESQYLSLVKNTTDWIWEMDLNRHLLYSNQQLETILGYSAEDLSELSFEQLIHPEDMEKADAQLRSLIAEKRGYQGWVDRLRHKDGSYRYLHSSATPVFDATGAVCGFRGIDRDVTLQTLLAEISSDLIKAPPDALDEKIEHALEQIARSYGIDRVSLWWFEERSDISRRSHEWAREGMRGPTEDLVTHEIAPWAFGRLLAGQTLKLETLEEIPLGAKADRAYFEAQGVKSTLAIPLFVDQRHVGISAFSTVQQSRAWPEEIENELRLLAETVANAHARSEAMQTIRRRERDLARSEQLAHVGTYTFHPRSEPGVFPPVGNIEFSKELCVLFDIEASEVSFELFVSRLHPDDRERVLDSIRHLLQEGSMLVHEYRIVKPSGEIVYTIDRIEVDRNEDGDITRIFGSQQDITELALREQKLKDALSEIEKLKNKLEEENIQLQQEIKTVQGFDQIVGDSPALRKCLNLVAKVAPTDVAVLILGETGTGKELIARAIHDLSPRNNKRLVSVNCAALPSELIESELFGHEKGAFTGAATTRLGRFELADGGTLFLDEIGDLPVQLQGKLLRVLQDGTFERLGGDKTLHVDIRLITATNRQLKRAVDRGEFRADLYYRINTFPIEVPSLAERIEDIPVLAEHFVRKHATRLGRSVEAISVCLLSHLRERPWPGNIRELESFIVRCLISTNGSVVTSSEDGEPDIRIPASEVVSRNNEVTNLREFKRNHILEVLEQREWVIDGEQGAASMLGLAPSTLRSKMKRLEIKRTE